MPEKPLTIATYALGASLAAISLLYVFGPTFALDADPLSSHGKQRRIVGLENPANMCFVNSVLQSLANAPELRKYLIRETHRRRLDGRDVYNARIEDVEGTGRTAANNQFKQDNLQQGIVTHALKSMLDRLNERPLYRKTITAHEFIVALETAFRTRISRQQQDAQEFLQLVLERLDDEYHAGRKARESHKLRLSRLSEAGTATTTSVANGRSTSDPKSTASQEAESSNSSLYQEDTFPFEGKLEGQITCETCGFEPKSSISAFVTLTLNVPQVSSTTLNKCFDGLLKNERIEDFKCDKCRLLHAQEIKSRKASSTTDQYKRAEFLSELSIINHALASDPEKPLPESVRMPSNPPLSTISRSMRISTYPRVLSIHLSRSMYSSSSYASKNTARVSFPESLRVGGLRDYRYYALSSAVMHKGGHNSGHYETFRRQAPAIPFSTPNTFGSTGPYSPAASPNASPNNSLRDGMTPSPVDTEGMDSVPESSTFSAAEEDPRNLPSRSTSYSDGRASPSSPRSSSLSSFRIRRSSSKRHKTQQAPTSAPSSSTHAGYSQKPIPESPTSDHRMSRLQRLERRIVRNQGPEGDEERRRLAKRRRRLAQRWWRVSDERVKECRTNDVLGMQREVYLLFYELDEGEELVGHRDRDRDRANGEVRGSAGVMMEMKELVDRTKAR